MEDYKIEELYDNIIEGKELTNELLKSQEFTSETIKELIQNGYLIKIDNNNYLLPNIKKLLNYGKRLLRQDPIKANLCFERCYEMAPNNFDVCQQLFINDIEKENYERALILLDKMYPKEECSVERNLYLLLLSMSTNLKDEYKEEAKKIKLVDIKSNPINQPTDQIILENKFKKTIYYQQFIYASKQLTNIINNRGKKTIDDVILRVLLTTSIKNQNKTKSEIIRLIKEAKYEELLDYYKKIEDEHILSKADQYTLDIINDLVKIKKTNKIPQKRDMEITGLFDMIKAKEYEKALQSNIEHNREKNIDNNNNAMFLLLTAITELIKSKQQEEKENIDISAVINPLMSQDIDTALSNLTKYLKTIDNSKYEFLIANLIKLSLIEQDIMYTKPMNVLLLITNKTFEFNVLEYVQKFYEMLSKNQLSEAKIYLDIISKSKELTNINIDTNNLEAALKTMYQEEAKEFDNSIKEESKNEKEIVINVKEDPKEEDKEKVVTKNLEQELLIDYINKNISKLKTSSIVILKPMNSDECKILYEIIKNKNGISSFTIGQNEDKRIVLRNKRDYSNYIDFKSLLLEANQAFYERNYDECIEKYKFLAEVGSPKAIVYGKLGLTYFKKKEYKKALNYLIVSTELGKKERSDIDYTELINRLMLKHNEYEDYKPFFHMELADFENDTDNYYGIDDIEELSEQILNNNDQDINVDTKNKVLLILARENYIYQNYKAGDKFIKQVEKSKEKSELVKYLLNEIRSNKKYYKYRSNVNNKQLLYKI